MSSEFFTRFVPVTQLFQYNLKKIEHKKNPIIIFVFNEPYSHDFHSSNTFLL